MKTSVFSNLVIYQLSRILQITCSHVFIAGAAMAVPRAAPFIYTIFPRILILYNWLEHSVACLLPALFLDLRSSLHFLAFINENVIAFRAFF